jgi:hypothetical protein
VAPLDVPWLRTVSVGLAVALVVAAFVFRADASSIVQVNQIAVGSVIAAVTLLAAIDGGEWLG